MQKKPTYDLPHPRELCLSYEEWRDTQVDSLEWLQEDGWLEPLERVNLDDSKFEKRSIKVLDAPTGTGKTGIILALAALNPDLRFLVMCATKLEQNQYTDNMMADFMGKYKAMSIRGRSNYHCPYANNEVDHEVCDIIKCWKGHVSDAPCTAGMQCQIKEDFGCPYYQLVFKARSKQIILTNYAKGFTMLNYAKGAFGKFDVIICDEAHILDGQLESFIKIEIYRQRFIRLFGFSLPEFDRGGSIPQWTAWVKENFEEMQQTVEELEEGEPGDKTKQEIRDFNSATDYLEGLCKIAQLEEQWVVEDSKMKVEVKPVWVTGDSRDVLFDHANRFVLMSGTIPSAKELARKVGIKPSEFTFFRLPYAFPVEHRLVYVTKGVPLSWKVIQNNLPYLTEDLDELLLKYAFDTKVLVHTVSYRIAKYLVENSSFADNFFIHETQDRMAVLQDFKDAKPPAILVSPSMDKAVDLPGDECGLIVICKIPFPNLGSPVMKRRQKQNRQYYINETLMTIMQMAGRGVRNMTDVCPTYVMDAAGSGFFKEARRLMPEGFKEALRMEDT